MEEPVRLRDEDEDVESACSSVLRQCVHLVAMRHFVETNRSLFIELEDRQSRLFSHDEWKHGQVQKKALARGRSEAAAPATLKQAGNHTKGQLRRSAEKSSADQSRGTALNKRMQDLAVSCCGSSSSSNSGGGGGGSSGSSSAPGVAARRGKCKGATPSATGVTPSPFGSYAESLLPASPPVRSQFVFEVEKPIMMHAPLDEHRQIQRRLSMLSSLQQETNKAERKARTEAAQARAAVAAGGNAFFKLGGERPIGVGGAAEAPGGVAGFRGVVPSMQITSTLALADLDGSSRWG